MNRRRQLGALSGAGFVATVVAANVLTSRFGFVPVGFGLTATAGTYAAGLALALRDSTQDGLGRVAVLVLVVIGAGLSALLADPMIALASGVAFLLSELVDFAVYTPLRARARVGDRRWSLAVVASNLAGAVVDTVVFVGIAFGTAVIWPAMPGQLVGKAWSTLAYLLAGVVIARALLRDRVRTRGH